MNRIIHVLFFVGCEELASACIVARIHNEYRSLLFPGLPDFCHIDCFQGKLVGKRRTRLLTRDLDLLI